MRWWWLAVVGLGAPGCKWDDVARDIAIEDVVARRNGDKVEVRVFVRNLGEASDKPRKEKAACVKATWSKASKVVATEMGCTDKLLFPDHSDEIVIPSAVVPPAPPRITLRVEVTSGACSDVYQDCYQDKDDGVWLLASP